MTSPKLPFSSEADTFTRYFLDRGGGSRSFGE